ncbi:MAG: ABC transporter ATP-binding protein [Flavisolibacter sp.]|jgi:ABC-type multidrug transport system ATPase subunit|nr:ABC transporter ATP-binding protein [Flavisolibacter sp.]
MKIRFSNAGKRFNREWIFRHLNLEFNSNTSYAVTGPNGSGKSTLLQCIGGMLQLSEGNVSYTLDKQVDPENVFKHVSIAAPYLEVVEEMTLKEFLKFHKQFKSFRQNLAIDQIIEIIGLSSATEKQIRNYSSGMKQRVKLAQCIFSDTDVVLLDEPCSNLDAAGIQLYHDLIKNYCSDRLVVVCSNDVVEYEFCKEQINMNELKNKLPLAGNQ